MQISSKKSADVLEMVEFDEAQAIEVIEEEKRQ